MSVWTAAVRLIARSAWAVCVIAGLHLACGSPFERAQHAGVPRQDSLAPARALLIDDVVLPFGGDGAELSGAAVLVRGGTIAWVGSRNQVPAAGDAEKLHAGGRFVVPGFIDLHQHAVGITVPAVEWVAQGITSTRDPGGDLDRGRAAREAVESGRLIGPRMFLGLFIDHHGEQNAESVRQTIRTESERGIDLVKLYLRTPVEHAAAAIEEARARNLPVTWHLSVPLSAALDLGVDGVEHLYLFRELMPGPQGDPPPTTSAAFLRIYERWARHLDPEAPAAQRLLRRFAQSGVIWTPTLRLAERIATGDYEHTSTWNSADRQVAAQGFEAACRMVAEANRVGVSIGAGTDTEDPADLHRELVLLVRCGLTPREALASATRTAARALRREGKLGAVQPGALADLIILDDDPTRNISATTRIWRVIKGGQVFTPATRPHGTA
jgi:hypothetical protein